uniref:Cytochrome c oxidase subunit 2 n=1 Tax=Aglaiogyrodactylus forficulatus TaxID=1853073 RepID=A0A173G4T6_9PLAT|nr:cytochrome c oxidase subunit II [Aglaiogyrodactylus forficulatus]ANH20408.1 cytochrome c oxidase subunit II [Aglaiogyrodactylus forficulatus]
MQNVFIYYNMVIYVSLLCLFLCFFVFFILILNSNIQSSWLLSSENHTIEIVWTLLPVILVTILCILNLDNINKDLVEKINYVVKIVGQQWRWSYENSLGLEYTSNFSMDRGVSSVDTPLYLPYGGSIQLLLSSVDVIHAFSLPDLGLKIDCIPGRINQLMYHSDCVGVFSGYCSELCGVGHSYMPIVCEIY